MDGGIALTDTLDRPYDSTHVTTHVGPAPTHPSAGIRGRITLGVRPHRTRAIPLVVTRLQDWGVDNC